MRKCALLYMTLLTLFIWTAAGSQAGGAETGSRMTEVEKTSCAAAQELGIVPIQGTPADGGEEAEDTDPEKPSLAWFEEKGLALGENSVAYPAIREGIMAEERRNALNDRILEDGRLREYVTRMSQLISGGKLTVAWRGTVLGPVFAFTVYADGAIDSLRPSWAWTGGNIDLRDGHEIRLEELFRDPEAAREKMESYLEEEVAPDLSAHLLNSRLTPLPELFVLSERGLIWKYAPDQLSTLSDRAGDVLIPWSVVQEELMTGEEDLPSVMGITSWLAGDDLGEENARQLREMAAEGHIPGIPVKLGDSLQALTDEWKMLTDPDIYALGRMFALEGACFRSVYLMTDYLSESWENSAVDGIRVDLGSVWGLSVGETRQETWRALLGEPDHTLAFDEEQAEAYRTVPGSRDYYEMGGHRLQLHADAEGVLVSVILSE